MHARLDRICSIGTMLFVAATLTPSNAAGEQRKPNNPVEIHRVWTSPGTAFIPGVHVTIHAEFVAPAKSMEKLTANGAVTGPNNSTIWSGAGKIVAVPVDGKRATTVSYVWQDAFILPPDAAEGPYRYKVLVNYGAAAAALEGGFSVVSPTSIDGTAAYINNALAPDYISIEGNKLDYVDASEDPAKHQQANFLTLNPEGVKLTVSGASVVVQLQCDANPSDPRRDERCVSSSASYESFATSEIGSTIYIKVSDVEVARRLVNAFAHLIQSERARATDPNDPFAKPLKPNP